MIQFTEEPQIECKLICGQNNNLVYGLCQPELVYGSLQQNFTLMCIFPFVFHRNKCICSQNYLLDDNQCLNILDQLKYLNQSNLDLENKLINNISVIQQQRLKDLYKIDQDLQNNTKYIENIVSQYKNQLIIEIYTVNKSLTSLANSTASKFIELRDDLQRVNNSMLTQIQLTTAQFQQKLISMNQTIQQQFEIQTQTTINVNQTMYNMNGQILAVANQINTNLQKQIDVTKSEVKTVQSSITGINAIINNINNVNAVQSADIQALKNQQNSNMTEPFGA
ncbi:Hypothetical_protein [Hexamita inflata]|uniref:Hypothetical_protein n=1 Tax=Hexamita inflata TaxID=28002 RepID=A0AA86QZY0_9EUKA|nr:Hypothetical protein HINF_LOCUS54117 [Hexamita inflata]CAI9966476.1 Hypothetical protein HINF_LOCUS54121 [Hexamita inflata]